MNLAGMELDEYQRKAAAVFQFDLGLGMVQYLSEAFRRAHQEGGVTPEAFWSGLFRPTGGYRGMSIKQEKDGSPERLPPDPYKELDFQACNKYLYFGGGRRNQTDGSRLTDSLVCLDYYGISHGKAGPSGTYSAVLASCMKIRNSFSHADLHKLEQITRQELDQSIRSMKDLTLPMLKKRNGWEKDAGLDPLTTFWRKQDKRYAREFGGAPIPLDELGHELFFSGEDALTPEQAEALEQAAEELNLKIADGNVYQEPDRKRLLGNLRRTPSVAALLPFAVEEAASRPDVDELPVLEQLEQPLWEPVAPAAAKVLQQTKGNFLTPGDGVINALLDSFTLTVDESILLSAEGRALLTEKLAPALMRRREKLLIDESVVTRLFRDFRGSVPFTPLELAALELEPEEAQVIQAERRKIHVQNKTAIKALGFLRKRGCLAVAASPTNSEYSFENLYRAAERYPQSRFLVLTTDRDLANELKHVYGRNAVAAKPTLNGQLLLFRATAPVYQAMLNGAGAPRKPAPAPALSPRPRAGSNDRVAVRWPDGRTDTLRLGPKLDEGGEGEVYATSAPGRAAKLYFSQQLTQERKDKLAYMLRQDPQIPGVCWPQALLYSERGEWLGFLMPLGEGNKLHLTVFHPGGKANTLTAMGWTRRNLVRLAANIAGTFARMHQKNILMGDVNARNFLVQDDCTVWLVDCDSYQTGPYRCPVGVQLYTPPEVQRRMKASGQTDFGFIRTEEHERYALAVLLFRILMLGKPPFESRNNNQEDVVQAILAGIFPYPYRSNSEEDERAARSGLRAPVGNWRNIWSHMPYQVKTGFYNVFTGKERLSAAQWEQVLQEYIRLIDAGYSSDELMPDSYKVVEDSDTKMVDLVCETCGCHFNLGEDVYLRRKRRGDHILCSIHWGVMQNMRQRQDMVRVTCGSCRKEFAITMGDWQERTSGRSRKPVWCPACLAKRRRNY